MFERVDEAGLDEGYLMMKQCYSGQFLNARSDQPNVDLMHRNGVRDPVVTAMGTAGKNDEATYSTTGPNGYGAYGYHFVAALAGTYPNGTVISSSAVDLNANGNVSWAEAHVYAIRREQFARAGYEHPQYAGSSSAAPGN